MYIYIININISNIKHDKTYLKLFDYIYIIKVLQSI